MSRTTATGNTPDARTRRRLGARTIIAGCLIAAGAVVGTGGGAQAGFTATTEGDVVITYTARGPAAGAVVDAITPELYDPTGTLVDAAGCDTVRNPGSSTSSVVYTCTDQTFSGSPSEEYVVGLADLPSSAAVSDVTCTSPITLRLDDQFPDARFLHTDDPTTCFVNIATLPAIHLDTVIIGGPAATTDFTFDIGNSDAVAATGVSDPASARCTIGTLPNDAEPTDCSSTRVPEGSFTISENTIPASYVATDFECVTDDPTDGTREVTTDTAATGPGAFLHDPTEATGTICTMTYTYVTQQIAVDVVVTNDDGGTATATDFTIELRDATDAVVQTGTDPEPGTGNASAIFTVPLGEYTITVTGPDGYTTTVETTVVDRAGDLAAAAGFTISQTQTVTGIVSADDDPAVTTTTATTTTTTVAPTTAVPTTTILTAELPATGSPSDTTLPLVLLAAGFVLAGAGAVVATRRR
ncbi:MAG: hypothetical protein AAGG08_15105 [Actinomycetota bacterium]